MAIGCCGATVGMLTIALAGRVLADAIAGAGCVAGHRGAWLAVIVQGVLGGMRVLLDERACWP